ncbi:MAG: ribonuclease Y [Minisyncoccia bacterium]
MNIEYFIPLLIGVLIGFLLRYLIFQKRAGTLEQRLKQRIEELKQKEQALILEAEKKSVEIIENARKEREKLLEDLKLREERVIKKEEVLDYKEKELLEEKERYKNLFSELEVKEKEIEKLKEEYENKLEEISGVKKEEALNLLFKKIEQENQESLLNLIQKLSNYKREEIEKMANEIILSVMPRYSRSVANEINITTVSLPSDDMKGRIIGKEGRNIRHFEKLTGVQVIVDETPEVVTLSSFDPVRREIARVALEKLIKDGRIHPATIEDAISKAKDMVEEEIKQAGINAALEVGIIDLPEELLHLMGRLKFRYSYGQNVLQHSIETAIFARMIGEELKLDKEVCKKAGFLHDIGKSVDHEIEGTHLEIGIKILERYMVDKRVILAMKSHHETYPFEIPEAYVVLAADAISSKRLGARSETAELYLKRVEELEKIAKSFGGIEKAYAISGGKELWVFVRPEEVSDLEMYKMAQNIAKKIEDSLRYPGEIKVVVIRESKAVEYAR